MLRFATVTEFLDSKNRHKPTEAERQLIADFQQGTCCILGDGSLPTDRSTGRSIRADLLRTLISLDTPVGGLGHQGLCLKGAYIVDTLDLSYSDYRGRCVLESCNFAQKPNFEHATLAQLNLDSSKMPGLSAKHITIYGTVSLRAIFSEDTVDVRFAKIGGQLDLTRANLIGPKLNLEASRGASLNAWGLQLDSDLLLNKCSAVGTVDLTHARIQGQLDCTAVKLDGRGCIHTEGEKAFKKGGEKNLALLARRLEVNRGFILQHDLSDLEEPDRVSVKGIMYMHGAHVGDLLDELDAWPQAENELGLSGFTFNRFGGSTKQTYAARISWLKRGSYSPGKFYPQPYTQVAKVMHQLGHDRDARRVLETREHRLAYESRLALFHEPDGSFIAPLKRPKAIALYLWNLFWDSLLFGVVGYGYAPMRSLISLLILFVVAAIFANCTWNEGSFAPNSDVILTSTEWKTLISVDCIGPLPENYGEPCVSNPADTWSSEGAPGMDWESFNHFSYAADLVVPVLDLGQTDAWAPSKDRGDWGWRLWWGRWFLSAFGWVVTALGVAAITGIMQRNRPE